MATTFHDTQFGHLLHFVSGKKVLQYPDEIDPEAYATALIARATLKGPAKEAKGAPFRLDENEEARDSTVLVDWYEPDDPEARHCHPQQGKQPLTIPLLQNPQNWSPRWKLFITFQICIMNFSFYIASSIYVPGEQAIMEDFGVSDTVATLGLSLFTIGYALGPMLWSPMSEMPSIGRNAIYFWTFFAFVLLQLPCGFASNMPMFLIFRILAGFVGSPALATGGATIADIFDPGRAAYGICVWGSFGICAPVFGPMLGGFSAEAKGWRITIWIVCWLASGVVVMLFFCMPESSPSTILYKRAKRLREATGDERFKSQSEIERSRKQVATSQLSVLGHAFILTFTEPIVFAMDLYTALLYGILFIWFESFPFVFGETYHFDLGMQGLVFLGIFVGGVITLPFFLLWIKYRIVPRFTKPDFQPEMVLPPTFFGSAALPICLFFYGWSSRESVHCIVPIIASSFFTVSIITLFNPVLNYLGIAYPTHSASVFAGNALFRASFGAIFPLFARQLFRNIGIGPGNSLLGGIAICFLPMPYVFVRYGKRLRAMSKRARRDD